MKTKMPLDVARSNPLCEPITRPGTHGIAFVPCASIKGLPWHVVYTKPQKERHVEAKLRQEGAAAWLPLQSDVLADRSRRIRPIFQRYLFMQMTGERLKWGHVIRNAGGEELGAVMRSPAGTPLILPWNVLEALIVQCAPNGIIYAPEPREIGRGDTGKVVLGPFSEFTGIVSRTSRDRVWLLLNVLGRPTETEFKRAAVELVA